MRDLPNAFVWQNRRWDNTTGLELQSYVERYNRLRPQGKRYLKVSSLPSFLICLFQFVSVHFHIPFNTSSKSGRQTIEVVVVVVMKILPIKYYFYPILLFLLFIDICFFSILYFIFCLWNRMSTKDNVTTITISFFWLEKNGYPVMNLGASFWTALMFHSSCFMGWRDYTAIGGLVKRKGEDESRKREKEGEIDERRKEMKKKGKEF